MACGLLGFSSFAQGNDLNQIQKQIKQQESKIAEQKRAQAKLQASLKDQESKINSVVGELRETELSLKEIRKQMAETEKQIKQLEKQERVQKAKLAKQIDAIYRSGVNPSTLVHPVIKELAQTVRLRLAQEYH